MHHVAEQMKLAGWRLHDGYHIVLHFGRAHKPLSTNSRLPIFREYIRLPTLPTLMRLGNSHMQITREDNRHIFLFNNRHIYCLVVSSIFDTTYNKKVTKYLLILRRVHISQNWLFYVCQPYSIFSCRRSDLLLLINFSPSNIRIAEIRPRYMLLPVWYSTITMRSCTLAVNTSVYRILLLLVAELCLEWKFTGIDSFINKKMYSATLHRSASIMFRAYCNLIRVSRFRAFYTAYIEI